MLRVTHAIYLVSDIDIAQQFLGGVLGLLVTADEHTVTGERFLTMGSELFGLVEFVGQTEIATLKKTVGTVDFILESDDAVAFIGLVERSGLTVHRRPMATAYGITAIFEDPFGYWWDVVQRARN